MKKKAKKIRGLETKAVICGWSFKLKNRGNDLNFITDEIDYQYYTKINKTTKKNKNGKS